MRPPPGFISRAVPVLERVETFKAIRAGHAVVLTSGWERPGILKNPSWENTGRTALDIYPDAEAEKSPGAFWNEDAIVFPACWGGACFTGPCRDWKSSLLGTGLP